MRKQKRRGSEDEISRKQDLKIVTVIVTFCRYRRRGSGNVFFSIGEVVRIEMLPGRHRKKIFSLRGNDKGLNILSEVKRIGFH